MYIYSVKKNNYEELIVGMIKRGIVLDHSKSPCEENFIPDKKVMIVLFGIVGHEQNILPQYAESLWACRERSFWPLTAGVAHTASRL